MSIWGEWKTATVAKNGTVSDAVNLGRNWEYLNIYIPAIDSSTIALQVKGDHTGGDYAALGVGSSAVTAATTGALYTTLTLGGYQFIKIVCGSTQSTAAVTFYVRGYRE